MMSAIFMSPQDVALHIARAAKEKRLSLNLSQKSLSERSGVSYGVIKKFEHSGQISLKSLLQLALVLDALNDFVEVFKATSPEKFSSLDALLNQKTRKRGRM